MNRAAEPIDTVAALWADAGLDAGAPERLALDHTPPLLRSSFALDRAAQAAVGAAVLAAAEVGRQRNGRVQRASVARRAAVAECSAYFSIDGRAPAVWDPLSGLYRCRSGHVRMHANFAHHRAAALRLLGLRDDATRPEVEAALLQREALDVEEQAAHAGAVVAASRSFDEWDDHAQGRAVAAQPLIDWQRCGDAPARRPPALAHDAPPLHGLRVLDITRILAGPVCGRTLAAYGAEVMLVNSPQLPNIEHIVDTSRGKLSCHVDLRTAAGRDALRELVRAADIVVQAYRPGALDALGFGAHALAALRPGIVVVSLSAYGDAGPWAGRRGFDSLVQTATGFNQAEAAAAGSAAPQALPVQMIDYASGFLMAFAAQAAWLRQVREGASWHLRVSLARTGHWLRTLDRIADGFAATPPPIEEFLETTATPWGELRAVRHAGVLQHTPTGWHRPSVPPGTHPAAWPADRPTGDPR